MATNLANILSGGQSVSSAQVNLPGGASITGSGGAITLTAGPTNNNITLVPSGTGAAVIPSSVTAGLQLYNTSDQVTNYERFSINWVANGATISSTAGGSGTARTINIQTASNQFFQKAAGSTSGSFQFAALTTSTAGQIHLLLSGGSTATSGTNIGLSITPTYNQSASTAANTDLLINRTQTSVGSGTQRLLDLQVGSTTQFNVTNVGTTTVCAATATPAAGSATAVLLFGTTSGFGIYYGSGAPTVSAAQGSLYLRSDGSSTVTRLYVNSSTGSGTTWTNFTSAT